MNLTAPSSGLRWLPSATWRSPHSRLSSLLSFEKSQSFSKRSIWGRKMKYFLFAFLLSPISQIPWNLAKRYSQLICYCQPEVVQPFITLLQFITTKNNSTPERRVSSFLWVCLFSPKRRKRGKIERKMCLYFILWPWRAEEYDNNGEERSLQVVNWECSKPFW